ncbi:hypothetical protein BLNAU_12594 [Blattamonas nauphoetae]|uniref:Uncharacterized protein n=1 Tax=Blattamonas nauphoetae TaxID=2049346 RepID=A0ABQ9XME4_9EUKA|nr:hypothetical protein BLNAU_12594 [Blattamonas nauphoetae]
MLDPIFSSTPYAEKSPLFVKADGSSSLQSPFHATPPNSPQKPFDHSSNLSFPSEVTLSVQRNILSRPRPNKTPTTQKESPRQNDRLTNSSNLHTYATIRLNDITSPSYDDPTPKPTPIPQFVSSPTLRHITLPSPRTQDALDNPFPSVQVNHSPHSPTYFHRQHSNIFPTQISQEINPTQSVRISQVASNQSQSRPHSGRGTHAPNDHPHSRPTPFTSENTSASTDQLPPNNIPPLKIKSLYSSVDAPIPKNPELELSITITSQRKPRRPSPQIKSQKYLVVNQKPLTDRPLSASQQRSPSPNAGPETQPRQRARPASARTTRKQSSQHHPDEHTHRLLIDTSLESPECYSPVDCVVSPRRAKSSLEKRRRKESKTDLGVIDGWDPEHATDDLFKRSFNFDEIKPLQQQPKNQLRASTSASVKSTAPERSESAQSRPSKRIEAIVNRLSSTSIHQPSPSSSRSVSSSRALSARRTKNSPAMGRPIPLTTIVPFGEEQTGRERNSSQLSLSRPQSRFHLTTSTPRNADSPQATRTVSTGPVGDELVEWRVSEALLDGTSQSPFLAALSITPKPVHLVEVKTPPPPKRADKQEPSLDTPKEQKSPLTSTELALLRSLSELQRVSFTLSSSTLRQPLSSTPTLHPRNVAFSLSSASSPVRGREASPGRVWRGRPSTGHPTPSKRNIPQRSANQTPSRRKR